MKSTLKIDYQGRGTHFVPIIKIVQPIEMAYRPENDEVFEDPKDKLISNLLYTPLRVDANQLFEITMRRQVPDENPEIIVTTMAALEEEQLFRRMKRMIQDRLLSQEDFDECFKVIKNNLPHDSIYSTIDTSFGFDKFLKIEEFFNWLCEQHYWSDTPKGIKSGKKPVEYHGHDKDGYINKELFSELAKPLLKYLNENCHPHCSIIIDCNHAELLEGKIAFGSEIADPKIRKILSEKSLRYIFETQLPEDAREKAFQNTPKHKWDDEVDGFLDGMSGAFNWVDSPEGEKYWRDIVNSCFDAKS